MTSRNSFRALCILPYLHAFFDKLFSKLVPFLAIVEEQQVKRSKPERVWTNLTDSDSGKIRDRVHVAIRLFEVSLVVAVLYLLIELSPR